MGTNKVRRLASCVLIAILVLFLVAISDGADDPKYIWHADSILTLDAEDTKTTVNLYFGSGDMDNEQTMYGQTDGYVSVQFYIDETAGSPTDLTFSVWLHKIKYEPHGNSYEVVTGDSIVLATDESWTDLQYFEYQMPDTTWFGSCGFQFAMDIDCVDDDNANVYPSLIVGKRGDIE